MELTLEQIQEEQRTLEEKKRLLEIAIKEQERKEKIRKQELQEAERSIIQNQRIDTLRPQLFKIVQFLKKEGIHFSCTRRKRQTGLTFKDFPYVYYAEREQGKIQKSRVVSDDQSRFYNSTSYSGIECDTIQFKLRYKKDVVASLTVQSGFTVDDGSWRLNYKPTPCVIVKAYSDYKETRYTSPTTMVTNITKKVKEIVEAVKYKEKQKLLREKADNTKQRALDHLAQLFGIEVSKYVSEIRIPLDEQIYSGPVVEIKPDDAGNYHISVKTPKFTSGDEVVAFTQLLVDYFKKEK